jgi:Tfp pilus assembly protein PilN
MENLCERLPDFTWLVSCEEKEQALIIEGKTFSFPEVANFMTRLSESNYIKSVDLIGIEQKDASKSFSFDVACKLNVDVPPEKANAAGEPQKAARQKQNEVR